MNNKLFLLLLLFPVLYSCDNFDREDAVSSGTADFSRYVAVGNSLTSGFMNGDLYVTAQWVSYPYLVSTKMARANGGKFTQPLMVDDTGFGNRIVFDLDAKMPKVLDTPANPDNKVNIKDQGPFNNMGVPGAKVGDLLATTGGLDSDRAEAYYKRFASNYGSTSIMDEVMAQDPTFVTLWIGANDAMGYALRGGDITSDPRQAITSTTVFRERFQAVVDKLNGTPGIVGNLPEISVIPHFDMAGVMKNLMSVDLFAITLTAEQAQMANAKVAAYDAANATTSAVNFVEGLNKAIVADANGGIRHIETTDKVLLALMGDISGLSTEIKENGLGWANADGVRPIAHKYILDANEIKSIDDAITAYNTIIAEIVSNTPNLHLVDLSGQMAKLKEGIPVEGGPASFKFTTDYLTGSFFSWDGVHPTGEGYAYIANQFIKSINENFESTLSEVNIRVNAAP